MPCPACPIPAGHPCPGKDRPDLCRRLAGPEADYWRLRILARAGLGSVAPGRTRMPAPVAPPRPPIRRDPDRINVASLGAIFANHGGTETWHRLLLPALESDRVHVLGYGVRTAAAGATIAGTPPVAGLEGMRALGRAADVAVCWGLDGGTLRDILPTSGRRPAVLLVAHGDRENPWQRGWLESARPLAARVVGVSGAAGGDVVIPNGIDAPANPARTHDGRTLGYVGRLSQEKGPEVAIRALAALPGWRLVVAGDGAERGALESLTATLGVADRVEWLGVTDPATVYPRISVLIFPSKSEGFGLSAAEAMAHGVPVVATPVGLLADRPDLAAIVPPDAPPEAWAAAVRACRDDDARTAHALEEIRRDFSAASFVGAWRKLILSVAPPPPPPGVGAILRRKLGWLRLAPGQSCGCKELADEMDERGPDWCATHTPEILDRMRDNAKALGVPFLRLGAAVLLRSAIREARGQS
jgi:glycosyltransferase involved in cell wall biosynthesis